MRGIHIGLLVISAVAIVSLAIWAPTVAVVLKKSSAASCEDTVQNGLECSVECKSKFGKLTFDDVKCGSDFSNWCIVKHTDKFVLQPTCYKSLKIASIVFGVIFGLSIIGIIIMIVMMFRLYL